MGKEEVVTLGTLDTLVTFFYLCAALITFERL